MNSIKCTHCGQEIELSEALTKDIQSTVLEAEHKKHLAEIDEVKKEAALEAQKQIEEAKVKAAEQAQLRLEAKLKDMQEESAADKKDNQELREQLKLLMQQLRESNKAKENAELEMQKRLVAEEAKIREAQASAVKEYARAVKDWALLDDAVTQQVADQRRLVEWWAKNVRGEGRHQKLRQIMRSFRRVRLS